MKQTKNTHRRRSQTAFWKKLCSLMLAVCLIGVVLLADHLTGVRATEDFSDFTSTETENGEGVVQNDTVSDSSEDIDLVECEPIEEDNEISDVEDVTVEDVEENADINIESDAGAENSTESTDGEELFTSGDEQQVAEFGSGMENEIVFDLAKGDVKFTDTTYSGFDANGNQITGEHKEDNNYVIEQEILADGGSYSLDGSNKTATSNTISIGEESSPLHNKINVYLAGVNIDAPHEDTNHKPAIYVNTESDTVNIILKDNSVNNVVAYAQRNASAEEKYTHSAVEKEVNTQGRLRIVCESGNRTENGNHKCDKDGECGRLNAYAVGGTTYLNGAGIGSKGYIGSNHDHNGNESSSGTLYNLDIAGGKIYATGAGGSGNGAGPGIGVAQSGPDSLAVGYNAKGLVINGGYIVARTGNGASACVGGGFHSGYIELTINGGYIDATREWNAQSMPDGLRDVGAAIGGGSGGSSTSAFFGTTVTINGGEIVANARYGAAIGSSAGGDNGNGAPATVIITGGTITAATTDGYGAAIGSGGSSKIGHAGDANIKISGGTITASSQFGADIGGGGTQSEEQRAIGGKGIIEISGSANIKALTNGIGGGKAKAGAGGDAIVTVTGGTVETVAIGGGNSESGTPGNAEVTVSGEKTELKSGTIGGGVSQSEVGRAVVNIHNGDVMGQVVMQQTNSTPESHCIFNMDGGILDNLSLDDSDGATAFKREYANGGVIYLTDDLGEINISGGTIQNGTGDLGGAIYLAGTNGTVNISGGTIQNCNAGNGGAVYMTAGTFTLSGNGIIQDCTATAGNDNTGNGGAVYLENGTISVQGGNIGVEKYSNTALNGGGVYLASGTMEVTGGSIEYNNASSNGGGAYLAGGTLTVTGGSLESNIATEDGGGAYISGGNFKLNGTNASVQKNIARNGAGIYLTGGVPELLSGNLTGNEAKTRNSETGEYEITGNGGGIYIDNQAVTFAPTGTVTISDNKADKGAGIYIGGSAENSQASFAVASNSTGTIKLLGNAAVTAGGGVCVDNGTFHLDNNKITVQGNRAYSGGGVAVLKGSFTQSGGIIGGDSSNENTAQRGGGVYVDGGTVTLNDGEIKNNSASNGGGLFASDGEVRMFGGEISSNKAVLYKNEETGTETGGNGGGIFVESSSTPAKVTIRSGKLSNNTSQGHGGAVAVAGTADSKDVITVGLLESHDLKLPDHKFTAFSYEESLDNQFHTHVSCPELKNNTATGNGGGIYMASSQAALNVYCLDEDGNTSLLNSDGNSVMAEGGTVVIGDTESNDGTNNPAEAKGNIIISSSMLVSGGKVDIYGNMDNPYFKNDILVDIKDNAGKFEDHRKSVNDTAKDYKVHYYENFVQGNGIFKARQYDQDKDISAEGALFVHEGYKIIRWDTRADGTGTQYAIGALIGSGTDHGAWQNREGKTEEDALELYAIWQRISYTVEFPTPALEHSGTMENQIFEYGKTQPLRSNAYKVAGKRFNGWNTREDGSGISYPADYEESKMTSIDGATVPLYAQWVDCTHKDGEHPGTLTYASVENTAQKTAVITETCDCGGHTASVTLSAVDVYYDGKTHPVTVKTSDNWLSGTSAIQYQYKADGSTEGYGSMPDGELEPTSTGVYKASMTVDEQTVSVEYCIKSAAQGVSVEGKVAEGEFFAEFAGQPEITGVPSDDAFTVQYTIQNLTTDCYTTEPVLQLSQELPAETTVIMQTEGKYWYYNVDSNGTDSLALNQFREMGSAAGNNSNFAYNTEKIEQNQIYRFIFNLSETSWTPSENSIEMNFIYRNKNESDQDVFGTAKIKFQGKDEFSITAIENKVTVSIPNNSYSRWSDKSLLLKIESAENSETTLPSDAKLTVISDRNTAAYTLNKNGQFIIPFAWSNDKTFTFTLSSDTASARGKSYSLTALLSATPGTANGNLIPAGEYNTGKTANVSLTIAGNSKPSLKVTGTQKLVTTTTPNMTVTVSTKNTTDCTVQATIQRKTETGYGGTYLSATTVNEGANTISLGGITKSGSYRLLITVQKNNQNILEVPYYFNVQ
ncbi:beta strand repeat-containing protein [Blautia sp. MSJ-19]|uniref:beta strand repeat-containing protein n=1 Tax=Blautia sp. MSJ-19 TaxID=2841517 RepID=UPI001C0EAEA7|nr:hypothetical protein [Blautia sp. MSJ-19]MBU5481402.1 hypothetical protein [Blautia sp. MSJ-19]